MSSYGRELVRDKKRDDPAFGRGNEVGAVALAALVEQVERIRGMGSVAAGETEVLWGVIDRDGMREFHSIEEFNEWLITPKTGTDCS